jgi:chromosome segregation ATPase
MKRSFTFLSLPRCPIPRGQLSVALVMLAVIHGAPCSAQSLEDRLRDQLRSTLNELHELQDQQAALQAQKTATELERDTLKIQLAAAKARLAHAGQNNAQVAAFEARVAKDKDAIAQATGAAQQAQSDHDKLQAGLTDAQKKLGFCEDKNAALYKLGNDILDAYEKFDMGDAIGANEPFIGIKRVELENAVQDFDDRLYTDKYDPNARQAPAAGGAHGSEGKPQ